MTNPETTSEDEPQYVIVRDRETTRHRPSAQRYGRTVEVPTSEPEDEN